jgi:pilus assembly protein CpaE
MKDVIRIVLVDPTGESRDALQRLLRTIGTIWVAEVFDSYEEGSRRIAGIAPDLTIIVLDQDPARAVDLIGSLAQADPPAIVLPASRSSDSALILRAIRAGAREFLTMPAEPAEVLEIINRLLRGRLDPSKAADRGPQIISVTGAAGGVGATSVAVNLAACLAAAKDGETILLDFDLIFGAVDADLDIIPDNTLYTVLQNFERLDQTLLKRSMTRHPSGLYVLPHPTAIEEAAKIDPECLNRLLGLLKGAFSTVVIDTSKGLQSSDFVAFEMSDIILVVIQLDLTCLRNSARLIGLFRQFDGLAERVKLVVNRAGSIDSEIGIKKAEETLKMPISWQVPNATKILQAARIHGVPIGEIAKGSRPHQVFLEMARTLRPPPEDATVKPRKGLFAAFF